MPSVLSDSSPPLPEVKRRIRLGWILGGLAGIAAVLAGLVLAVGGPMMAVAVMLSLILSYVILRNLEVGFWSVVVVICLLPFATIPVDIGLTPTLLDLALAATIGMWALEVSAGRTRTVVTTPLTIPLVVFTIIVVFAFIFGLNNGPLTPNLLRHFAELILSIAFALVVIDYCVRWERIERLVRVIMIAGAGAAGLGVFLWMLPDLTANDILNSLQRIGYPGGFVIRYIEDNPELAERAIGTSVDPNALGGLLLMVGALASPQLVARRPLFRRSVIVGIIGLTFVALVLTFSRGAMVGLAAGLGFVAAVRHRRYVPYLVVAALLFLILPATQDYVSRLVEGLQGQDLATQMRFGEYRDALELIGRYPVFGVGFSGSPDIDLYLGVANVYFTIAQQTGFIGLIGFLSVVLTAFGYAYASRRFFRTSERCDPIWIGLHATLVGGLVAGIFDHYLFNIEFHHAVTIFWLFVGVAVAASRLGMLDVEP